MYEVVTPFNNKSDGKVGRVNIVTHTNGDLLALSGEVDGTSGTTMLGMWAPPPLKTFDPTNHPEDAVTAGSTITPEVVAAVVGCVSA